jgi:iron complex outermembrane receptor protein
MKQFYPAHSIRMRQCLNLLLVFTTMLLISPMAILANSSRQENGSISGKITTSDQKPAEFSTVVLEGKTSVQVDKTGKYTFEGLAPGTYTLKVSFVGQKPQLKTIVLQAGERATADFSFSSTAKDLNEVLIVGDKYNVSSRKESRYVSRLPLKNLENPQVYSVVDKELIKEQMALTLEESFRNIPGAAPAKTGAGMPAFFSRGFQTSENFRNGMATSLRTGIDLSMVERVEAVKGPSATLFGAAMTSFGGLVNYVTKKPYDKFGGEISYIQGSFDLSRLTADINTPVNEDKSLLFRLNLATQKENSFQDQGFGTTYVVAPSISYRVNDRLIFRLDADLQTYKGTSSTAWAIGTGVTAKSYDELGLDYKRSLIDNSFVGHQSSNNVYAQAEYKISDKWTSQTNYSFGNGEYNDLLYFNQTWLTNTTIARAIGVFSPDKSGRKEIQQNFIGDFKIGNFRNRLVVGLDYMSQFRNFKYTTLQLDTINISGTIKDIRVQQVENRLGTVSTPESLNKQNTYSAYVSDVFNFSDALMAMVSLRADRFMNEGTKNNLTQVITGKYNQTAFSPKFGVVYQPIKDKVAIFGNYMNGFKNVANTTQPDGSVSNFKPQQANQWEGGVKFDLMNKKLNATISYYDISVKNITRVTAVNNQNFTVQDGTQESKGVEIEFIGNPFPGFNLVSGYGYNDNKFKDGAPAVAGKRAVGTPKNVANIWLGYTLLDGSVKGLGFGAGAIYVDDAYFNAANTFVLPQYTVVDVTVFFNRPKYRFSFKANNILNEKYWISDGFYARPQKPLNFLTSVTFKF